MGTVENFKFEFENPCGEVALEYGFDTIPNGRPCGYEIEGKWYPFDRGKGLISRNRKKIIVIPVIEL